MNNFCNKKFIKGKYIILIILITIIFGSILSAQSIQFYQEKIEIEINDDYCSISGIYYFRNNNSQDIRQTLYYPFVINDEMSFPHHIEVTNLSNSKTVLYRSSDKGVYFPINVIADSIAIYKVIYHQKTNANKIEYILTTTQKWGIPFEVAEYIIKIPENYKIKSMSIEPDTIEIKDNKKILTSNKTNYMPTTNFTINWEDKNESK